MFRRKQKIGLVLSGGGTRGLAHVGVWKILERLNFVPDAIAGCSIGSIIGSFIAAGKSAAEMEEFSHKHDALDVLSFSISKLGFNRLPRFRDLIEDFTGAREFHELTIPLYINATNMTDGTEVIFKQGPLFPAIRASMAVPGIFAPVEQDNDLLIDGGIINQAPFSILPDDIEKYLIIFVSPYEHLSANASPNLSDVLDNSLRLMQYEITKLRLKNIPEKSYLMLSPDLSEHAILEEKKHFPEIIRLGFETAYEHIDEIRAFIQ